MNKPIDRDQLITLFAQTQQPPLGPFPMPRPEAFDEHKLNEQLQTAFAEEKGETPKKKPHLEFVMDGQL